MARLTFKTAEKTLKGMGFNLHRNHGKGVSKYPYMIGRTYKGEIETLCCVSLYHAISQAESCLKAAKTTPVSLEMTLLMSMK